MCKPLLASINSPRLCGHSVGLVFNCDSRLVYSLFSIPPKNLGDPGSSRGTLERNRVGLTVYIPVKVMPSHTILSISAVDYGPVIFPDHLASCDIGLALNPKTSL
jgi:hypothetical protein